VAIENALARCLRLPAGKARGGLLDFRLEILLDAVEDAVVPVGN
jgi:hypothetical protein